MHKYVDQALSASRKPAVERHNAKTHMVPQKPTFGDYVAVARTHGPRTKMSTNWVGLRRMSRILVELHCRDCALTYQRDCCRAYLPREAVCRRLVGTPAQMQEVVEFSDHIWYYVDKIEDIREAACQFEVSVAWKGLTTAGNS